MRDRVPKNHGRVRLTPVPGQDNLYDLVRADDPITEGTPLCKATLLPDSVCDVLGIDRETSTPADALLAIPAVLGKALLRITAKHADGSAYVGLQINGITGVDAARCVTDDAGKLMVYVSEGSYTLSSAEAAKYIDTTTAAVSVSIKAGEIRDVTIQETAKTTKRLEIKTTQNIMFSRNVASVDVFCVGGGGGGGIGKDSDSFGTYGGGGGGGGYTATRLNVSFQPNTAYSAVIGAGGLSNGARTGGASSCLGVSANGGEGGDNYGVGGSGGSGGGSQGYNGGENGSNDASGRIKGQGTTTKAFGETNEEMYAAGGGGGGTRSGSGGGKTKGIAGVITGIGGSGVVNTGGGGGGGTASGSQTYSLGGNGGSGIIIIRWRTKT